MKITILFSLLTLCLFSCTQRVYLTISDPPAVYIEKEFETAAVINRTYSSGASKPLDLIDNAFSLEGKMDHTGSKAAVQGLFDELSVNPKFKYVALLDSMTVENGGIDVFSAQLPWSEVEQICEETGVQLLFVLELYDTDTKISYSNRTITKTTPLGDVPIIEHVATMNTSIKTGWRIYDPKNKLIRDQFFIRDNISSSGRGINPVKAASVLVTREQAVTQISRQVGQFYEGRLLSKNFRVWREYYNKGSKEQKIANRRAEVNDWDGAGELWLKETESPKRKVAGRACHNMAIYAEINGDLYGALEWAQKAYSDYNNKEAHDYARLLKNRINRWEQIQQLEEQDNQQINGKKTN